MILRQEEAYKKNLINTIKYHKLIFTRSKDCILCGTNTFCKKDFEKHNKTQKHEKNLMLLEDISI